MLDIHAHQYLLEDGKWHLWNWLKFGEPHYTDCGIVMGIVKENRLSGVNGVDRTTLCPKCFAYAEI